VTRPLTSLPGEAQAAILAWYGEHGRRLAFRGATDPYAVLVSEVMAQQTQVGRVGERWSRFLARFPSVAALADASPADVLREWQGLGYDRRALNLRRAAIAVVEQHQGVMPSDVASLEALPGVGPYTARAVAAIAFGQRVGAVDTNVRRVLGRVTGVETSALQGVADASVPRGRAADWTHALMDLGATICLARIPRCGACPLAVRCPSRGRRFDPARKQSRFEGSFRQRRARTLRLVAERPRRVTGLDREAVEALRNDGLVEIDRASVRLAES
jgi:A/G-specific adenine glycosylase